MALNYTSSSAITRYIIDAAVKRGADRDTLLRKVGLSQEQLDEPESRVPSETHVPMLDEAVRMTGDEDFGLHAGELFGTDPANATLYLFMNCPTMGEGIRLMEKYYPALSDTVRPTLNVDGSVARIKLVNIAPELPFSRQSNEWTITAWLTGLRMYAGNDFNPVEVRFAHAAPKEISEAQRVFRAPLVFDRPHSELVLRREDLDIPHPTGDPDPDLLRMVEHHAQAQIEKIRLADPFMKTIREHIKSRLSDGAPSICDMAGAMGLTERTLQRKLRTYGGSFSELLGAIRKEEAVNFLEDRNRSAEEIGFLLGYSASAAFYRAFRRWYGATPAEFRRRMKVESPSDPETKRDFR